MVLIIIIIQGWFIINILADASIDYVQWVVFAWGQQVWKEKEKGKGKEGEGREAMGQWERKSQEIERIV